ncbi:MAG: HAMP domain-containing histidine kinase [Crocinitomicaceae bacterium]|nr:HAMP domain-containing histidine kinase [Crocinitomicaceae bacterium]
MATKKNQSYLIFYLLVAYIFAQFFWWTYLILKLNQELYVLRHFEDFDSKLIMILGEGSIFLVLLIAGAFTIKRTFSKEINLAEQQTNFLLSVTHELKSPIASIKLQIETLLKRDLDLTAKEGMYAKILLDTNRLNDLVDNVLTASRISDDDFSLNIEKQNISQLVKELVQQFSESNTRQADFNFSLIEEDIELLIDSSALNSIVTNLLENATKYSEANTSIDIKLAVKNNQTTLSIADQGVGISDKNKALVFQKFQRLNSEMTRTTKGTGLGLYIVHHLVNKHNGTIIIIDNSPKGTIFEITFNKN